MDTRNIEKKNMGKYSEEKLHNDIGECIPKIQFTRMKRLRKRTKEGFVDGERWWWRVRGMEQNHSDMLEGTGTIPPQAVPAASPTHRGAGTPRELLLYRQSA